MIRIPRTEPDIHFMLVAHLTATRSTCDRGPQLLFDPPRHGVGAVIVRDGRVVAGGYNGSPPGCSHCSDLPEHGGGHILRDGHCVRTIHSEANALMQCALDGVSPAGACIYCTASPCYDCAKLILRAKIVRVVVGEPYNSRYGLSATALELLQAQGLQVQQLPLSQAQWQVEVPDAD